MIDVLNLALPFFVFFMISSLMRLVAPTSSHPSRPKGSDAAPALAAAPLRKVRRANAP